VANIETSLKEAMTIEGAIGVALVDYTSGLTLGVMGGGAVMDMDTAAAGNTDVVRAKVRTLEMLGLGDKIEDILITLDTQYHLIRLLQDKRSGEAFFLYLALGKSRANLGLARHQLRKIEAELEI
jgi:UDP-2,3-diacylglucosamine pyrophosphatase LpxH